jgi:GTPase
MSDTYRSGFVGLIGQPNSGKSTLLNLFVKEKISIVTDKPQTTRRRVLGVISQADWQIVLVDAPGLLSRRVKGLNVFLKKEAEEVMSSSDALIGVIALDEKDKERVMETLNLLKSSGKPFIVVVNKSDLSDKKHRLTILRDLVEKIKPGTKVFEFSAKWGKDIAPSLQEITQTLVPLLPLSKGPLYDPELFTPHPVRELAAEIIREKCFETLTEELPYSIAVRIQSFTEPGPEQKLTKIQADILVSRTSQLKIVVGQKGRTIKQIGTLARKDLEKLIQGKVFLGLQVVVRESWFENKNHLRELGYINEPNS